MKFRTDEEILQAVLDRLNHGGKHWIKGSYHREQGEESYYCIVGALRKELGWRSGSQFRLTSKNSSRYRRLLEIIRDAIVASGTRKIKPACIERFNDSPNTKWADVKRVLKKATVLATYK